MVTHHCWSSCHKIQGGSDCMRYKAQTCGVCVLSVVLYVFLSHSGGVLGHLCPEVKSEHNEAQSMCFSKWALPENNKYVTISGYNNECGCA